MPYPLIPLFDPDFRASDIASTAGAPVRRGPRKGLPRGYGKDMVAEVRRLIEHTPLTYAQITARTGVASGTIAKWKQDGGWRRHPFAPVANDRLPSFRASRELKLRMLRNRLYLLAERCACEFWNSPAIDPDRLVLALRVLKTARREYAPHRRPRCPPDPPARTGQQWAEHEAAIRKALVEMRRSGVSIDRIPDDALALLDDTKKPPKRTRRARRPCGPQPDA